MTISIGDRIPEATLTKASDSGPRPDRYDELLRRLPGRTLLRSRRVHADLLGQASPRLRRAGGRAEGQGHRRDRLHCYQRRLAWGKSAGVDRKVTMLADGNGNFANALGLSMDASTFGMGSRGKRYSMVVNDGVVVLRDLDRTELTMLSQVIVAAAD
jgi:hypothetical protein